MDQKSGKFDVAIPYKLNLLWEIRLITTGCWASGQNWRRVLTTLPQGLKIESLHGGLGDLEDDLMAAGDDLGGDINHHAADSGGVAGGFDSGHIIFEHIPLESFE